LELVELFKDDTLNKIGFEYLVAENLLDNGISPIVDNLRYFRALGYDRLPRHIQEALVFQMSLSNTIASSIGGYQIDTDLFKKFNDFSQTLYKYRDDRNFALKSLAPQYWTNYWYYLASNGRPVNLKKNG
jgi:hypothetical protein